MAERRVSNMRTNRSDPISVFEVAVSAALPSIVWALHLPLGIYARHRLDLDFGAVQYLILLLPVALICTAVCAGVGAVLRPAARLRWVTTLRVLGTVLWAWSSFVVFRAGALDGNQLDLASSPALRIVDGVGFALALVVAWAILRRWPLHGQVWARSLAAVLLVAALVSVARDLPRWTRLSPSQELGRLARFSSTGNVIIILLDTFPADVFEEIVGADAELRGRLAGFTFFRDTVGAAPSTLGSVGAIHAALPFDGTTSFQENLSAARARGTFLTRLSHAGYEVALVNPFGLCARRDMTCRKTDELSLSARLDLARESALLLDLALLRVVPVFAKGIIYDQGRWLVGKLVPVGGRENRPVEELELLRKLRLLAGVDDGRRAAKFIHLAVPHSPLVFDAGCSVVAERAFTREAVYDQGRCALREVTGLFGRLDQLGVYHSAVVAVLSDHGSGLESAYAPSEPTAQGREFALRLGRANPLLAIKPPDTAAPFQVSTAPAHIADLGATVCTLAGCSFTFGEPLFPAPPAERVRAYTHYAWHKELWTDHRVPPVIRYTVSGPVHLPASWSARGNAR